MCPLNLSSFSNKGQAVGRLQIDRSGCIQYIFLGEKKERDRELALGFVEIQWLLGGLPEVGGGSIDQMGCPGGGKVIGHETAQDLSSQLILKCRFGLI